MGVSPGSSCNAAILGTTGPTCPCATDVRVGHCGRDLNVSDEPGDALYSRFSGLTALKCIPFSLTAYGDIFYVVRKLGYDVVGRPN